MSDPLQILDTEETDLKAAISRSQERLEYIAELRKKFGAKPGKTKGTTRESANGTLPSTDLLSPSKAVAAFLTENPGSKRKDVIDNVAHRMKTSAKNPKDVLRTILGQLVSKGRLVEDEQGRLKVAKKGE